MEMSIELLDNEPEMTLEDAMVVIRLIKNDRMANAIPLTSNYRKPILDVIRGFELQEAL